MATKENFNKAMYDMFGVGSNPPSPDGTVSPTASAVSTASPASAAPAAFCASADIPPIRCSGITYLAPGTCMEGKLTVKGDVEVAGDFKGEMVASGNVALHASISSNITAARLDLIGCKLTGDVHASGTVRIDEQSHVEGNLFAAELVCSGSVKGDIQVNGHATFQAAARVQGNITTGTMSMECGSIVSGTLVMNGVRPQKVSPCEAHEPPTEKSSEPPAQTGSARVPHPVH